MNDLIVTHPVKLQTSNFCRACGCELQSTDNFCGQCGAGCRDVIVPVHPTAENSESHKGVATTAPAGSLQTVVNNRMLVIGAIVCAGPLGLLALWCSQSFAIQTKIITTVIYFLLVVVAPVALIYYCLSGAFQPIVEALS